MNAITKVSDITPDDLAEYLRIPDPDESDAQLLDNLLNVAKEFIKSYTGQTDLDGYSEFVICVFVLVQDMYDTRSLYVDKTNLNNVVENALNLHSVNYV